MCSRGKLEFLTNLAPAVLTAIYQLKWP